MNLLANLLDQCSPDDRQNILKATWIVAFSDGRLYAEKSKLQQIRKELDVGSAAASQVEQEVRSGKARLTVPGTEAARRVMYHYALQMTASDGRITSEEQSIALRLGDAMGLSRKHIQAELKALAPQKRKRKKKRTQQRSESPAHSEHATLKSLLVALAGQEFADSPVVSFLLTRQSMLVVILTNLIPVFGVLFYDWRVFTIVFLYWLENIIIGVFNIAKMITCSFHKKSLKDLLVIPFFTIHYGIFVGVHGVFVFALFHEGPDHHPYEGFLSEFTFGIVVALSSLAIEHAYLFYTTFVRTGLYKRVNAAGLMLFPYPRIVVLHVAIIFGGFLIMTFGIQSLVLVLLIPLKILVDLLELRIMEKFQQGKNIL